MSAILREALAAALESIDDDLPRDTPEENVAEALLETEQAAQEAEEAEEVVEELEDADASLEAIVTALESHIAEGGMTPQTARSHNVAMENLLRRLPIDSSRYTVSHEAFGGTRDRLTASQEALEGAKNLLSRIWEGIKSAISKAWNAVKTFFATIGKSARALKAGAADLKSKAEAASGHQLKEGAGEVAVPPAVTVGSTFSANVSQGLAKIVAKGKEVAAASNEAGNTLESLAKIVGTGNGNQMDIAQKLAAITDKGKLSDDLPGQGGAKGENKVKTPSPSEAALIAKQVDAIASDLVNYSDKVFKAMEAKVNSAIKTVDARVTKDQKGYGDEGKGIKEQLQVLNKGASQLRTSASQYASYAARTAKAALGYGYAIVKQYAPAK